jgi:glycosyltransferase involved in cell wall biosynthesis
VDRRIEPAAAARLPGPSDHASTVVYCKPSFVGELTPPHPGRANLLCVCNYPSNTGYAWDFIESLYARLADRLAVRGVTTYVAYPRIDAAPRPLAGSRAQAVTLDATLWTSASVRATMAFVRAHDVRCLYLTDAPVRDVRYAALRLAGVRHVLVHDHTSGARSRPEGPRRALKWLLARLPLISADHVVAVSEFVKRRQIDVGLVPARKVTRVWNGAAVSEPLRPGARPLHDALGLDPARPTVVTACRAAAEKGVPILLRAFDRMLGTWPVGPTRPLLVYMGDGPQFAEITRVRETLAAAPDIVLTGYRADAGRLVPGADVCAMPSLWEDALPLAVLQPMGMGLPVVASRVGGIPEMIEDGRTGLLVPAGDVEALAVALGRLLADPATRAAMGEAGRRRVADWFTPEQQIDALTERALAGLGLAPGPIDP